MVKHPSHEAWESTLKKAMDELDDFLEDKFGGKLRLHPARAERGKTANKAHDGLFDIVASFSMGSGSELGRGYVVDVDMATLQDIPPDLKKEIEDTAIEKLQDLLPKYFPGKDLKVERDGKMIKLHGDLSLGSL